jgi:hypothetical protein
MEAGEHGLTIRHETIRYTQYSTIITIQTRRSMMRYRADRQDQEYSATFFPLGQQLTAKPHDTIAVLLSSTHIPQPFNAFSDQTLLMIAFSSPFFPFSHDLTYTSPHVSYASRQKHIGKGRRQRTGEQEGIPD